MRRLLGFLAALALGPAPPAQQRPSIPELSTPPGQAQAQKPSVQKMRVVDGRVVAELADAPLQSVLEELAERTGVIFEVRTQENPGITLRLDAIPLENAIRRIAAEFNLQFYYGEGADQPEHVTLVRVFPRTPAPQQPAITYLGTGAVTKSNDFIETPEQALEALAQSKSLELKEKAIEILVASKSDLAPKALMASIADPAPEIRVAAIEGLVVLRAQSALEIIVRCLRDNDPGVRQSAVTAVALLGDSANIKDIRPLRRDTDSSVAAAAEMAIRKLSSVESKGSK